MKLLLIICCLVNLHSSNDSIEYNGTKIDFVNYQIATLYKGHSKQLLADKLDVKGIYRLASKEKNVWYLTVNFNLTEEVIGNEDIWMQFRTNINAANIYLNDQLFFRNGTVEKFSAGTGGKNIVRKRIPKDYLLSGSNKIEVEFTNFKNQKGVIFRDLSLGKLQEFQRNVSEMTIAPIFLTGIFVVFVLINIVLYFSLNRKNVFILLAILFSVSSILTLYEVVYWNGLIPSVSFIHNLTLRAGLEYLTYFVLIFVLYYEYQLKTKHLLFTLLAFISAYVVAILANTSVAINLSFIPFGLSILAVLQKKKNSILISFSLFTLFALNYIDDHNILDNLDSIHSNFIITSMIYKIDNFGIVIFALVMIYRILFKTKALNEAQLKLERIEYQFLQKHILPHFLINSLMSLQQLIVKEPNNASKMVEALSEEFHLLSMMGKKKLIPIHQEIEICKTHLKIMSIQQKATYNLEVKDIQGNEMIPPAVIHTLVENGITHGYSGNQNAYFILSKIDTINTVQYCLFNDSKTKTNNKVYTSGTGLKYIEARLEECYPGKWKLNSNQVTNGWESIIEISK